MPGQWEQRQFLVRCPNNRCPQVSHLPRSLKKEPAATDCRSFPVIATIFAPTTTQKNPKQNKNKRRNPGGAGLLFGLWSVYRKGQSAVALTWVLLREELPLSPIFLLQRLIGNTGASTGVYYYFLNSLFSFCAYMQEGGATLPLQLLMIMSAQIMTSLVSVQQTPVVHRPFIDVVECAGTHHRRILHPCLFPF